MLYSNFALRIWCLECYESFYFAAAAVLGQTVAAWPYGRKKQLCFTSIPAAAAAESDIF